MQRSLLSERDIEEMFALFHEHYDASRAAFLTDLNEKQWVIRLYDGADLAGFTTILTYETEIRGRTVGVVYSGDTIVRPDCWGTESLPRAWIGKVLELSVDLVEPLYWLLLVGGYKTYRFLPVFYRTFYPRHDEPTPPDVQDIMDRIAFELLGDEYDPALGIARFSRGATPLREGVADMKSGRQRNPHISYFLEKNPGYVRGDELVCITRVHRDNFTKAGERMARASRVPAK